MSELGWLIRPSPDVSWAWTWSEVNAEGALTAEWQVIEVADAADIERLREAVREACLHQGLPEDAPPERVAAHFRNNRELREGFDALGAASGKGTTSD